MDDLLLKDVYGEFLSDQFDVKAYASQSIQAGLLITDQLAKLSDGIRSLDKELKHQVSLHHEDLLSQVVSVETLEHVLDTMHLRIQSLLSAVERLRVRVAEPYEKISNLTNTLSKLQAACDTLRSVARVSYLTSRLRDQIQGGSKEITKSAQTLGELSYVGKTVDLSGLDSLEKDQQFIRQARNTVESQADDMLREGMEQHNQSQVATALQVFLNLEILAERVARVVDDARRRLESDVKNALDLKQLSYGGTSEPRVGGPGRAAIPSMGSAAVFRTNLWHNVEQLTNQIYDSCSRVQHLQRVLFKKRDPVTHVPFIQLLLLDEKGSANDVGTTGSRRDVTSVFWDDVTRVLTKEFVRAANESMYIKQAFEGEFPKLLRLYGDLWRRLRQFSSNISDAGGGIDDESSNAVFDPEAALRATLESFQNAYHSRSLSRLFDPINVMFSPGCDLPTTEEVDSVVRIMVSELNVAPIDRLLGTTVAKNVANTVQLFVVKCEEMLSTDGEASQVIGPPTAGQTNNAAIVDLLHLLECKLKKVLREMNSNFPNEAIQIVTNSLKLIETQMVAAIQPLLLSVEDAIESILLTMHDEDFSVSTPTEGSAMSTQPAPCSLYMKELQDFVARVRNDYLSQYKSTDFIKDNVRRVACRTIELFVRHVSLVRPLSEGGKRRLAADFAQMELCLRPLCSQLNSLGHHYRMLRAFKPLLFQTSEHVINSPALGNALPYSTVLHFLFSKAPSEFRSPHQTVGWSRANYSTWLDNHPSELDRLEFIHGAVESYVGHVRQKQSKKFAPVYPVMVELLQTAMKQQRK